MTGMVQTDLVHPTAPKYKDEPVDDTVSDDCYFLFSPYSCLCSFDADDCDFLPVYVIFPLYTFLYSFDSPVVYPAMPDGTVGSP